MTRRAARPAEQPGPNELRDPLIREELKRAIVWIGVAVGVALIWLLAQPLLLIFGGLVFAAILDGGTRLLGRVLPIARGWRLLIVCLLSLVFLLWAFWFSGSQIAGQAEAMRIVVTAQVTRILGWAQSMGLIQQGGGASEIGRQIMGSFGQLTAALGTAFGVLSSGAMIIVLGIFIAIEPRLYERGIAWMLPIATRARFYGTMADMGRTMRRLMAGRLLGMAVEGFGSAILLSLAGVPMATMLGIVTGLLAFLPNIGLIIAGALTVLVGFSAGTATGFWALGIYLSIQAIDGYLIVPTVARRSVDLAPALVLGAQLLFGALFGILGLTFADSLLAMAKVALERKSEAQAEEAKA